MAHSLELRLPPERTAPAAARRFVTEALRGWGCRPAIESVELLVSELVTNSVVHALSPVVVGVLHDDSDIRVSVADSAPCTVRSRVPTPDDTSGRGLFLVSKLSRSWGCEEHGHGKVVWFEVSCDPSIHRRRHDRVGVSEAG